MPTHTKPTHDPGRHRVALPAVAGIVALLFAIVPAFAGWIDYNAAAQDQTEGQGLLRAVHASTDAGAVDILLDDQPVLTNVQFGTVSEYLPVTAGESNVKVVPTGGAPEEAVIDETITVEDGVPYIFAAAGPVSDIQAPVFQVDRNQIEEPDNARVRVIHLSPDAGPVDVFVAGGDALVEGVEYPNASDYIDVAAGQYDFEVRSSEDDGNVTVQAPGVSLEPGMVYDILAIGQAVDNSIQLVPVTTGTLMPCAMALGIEGTEEDACVRVVHVSPDAPAVDVYVDEAAEPTVANLGYGQSTPEWLPAPSGEHQIRVTPTGEPIEGAVIDETVSLEAGMAYDLAAINLLDDIELASFEVDVTPLPEGQARLAMVHAVPDADAIEAVVAQGPTLAEDLEFNTISEAVEFEAGSLVLEIQDGDGTVLVSEPNAQFEAGMGYHGYVIGQAADASLAILFLPAQIGAPVGEPGSTPVATTPGADPVEEEGDDAADEADDLADAAEDAADAAEDAADAAVDEGEGAVETVESET